MARIQRYEAGFVWGTMRRTAASHIVVASSLQTTGALADAGRKGVFAAWMEEI